MDAEKKSWGGCRPNSGRPTTERKIAVSIRVSKESADILEGVRNKSAFIDDLIKNAPEQAK